MSTWMIVDAWVAGPLIPTALEIWIEVAAALGVGIAVARRPPSALFCRRTSLYHAFDDPLELENRIAEHPELVARYQQLLEPRLALLLEGSGDEAPGLDAETRKALQSLGYVQ